MMREGGDEMMFPPENFCLHLQKPEELHRGGISPSPEIGQGNGDLKSWKNSRTTVRQLPRAQAPLGSTSNSSDRVITRSRPNYLHKVLKITNSKFLKSGINKH